MTMPSLVANYQKKMWVTQLKKTVSTIEQGLKLVLAEDGVDKLSDSSLVACEEESCSFNKELFLKIFNANELKSGKFYDLVLMLNLGGGHEQPLALPDGSCMSPSLSNFLYGNSINFFVDTNCDKAPNIGGRDIYVFYVSNYGNVIMSNGSLTEYDETLKNAFAHYRDYEDYFDDDYNRGDFAWELGIAAFVSVIGHGWEMVY